MKIGELAKRSGLSTSRIRFYEASGLLNGVERKTNGYREYSAEALVILEIITTAQKAGFTLVEIRGMLPTDVLPWHQDKIIDVLRRKVTDLEAMEQRIAANKLRLITLIKDSENTPQDADCVANIKRALNFIRQGDAPPDDRLEGATLA